MFNARYQVWFDHLSDMRHAYEQTYVYKEFVLISDVYL